MVTFEKESGGRAGGFRLGAREDEPRRARAPSVSSVSLSLNKQKIDALFDDTRSIASLPRHSIDLGRRDSKVSLIDSSRSPIFEDDHGYCQSEIKDINNTVQDRIERMFAEMAGESRVSDNIGVHVFNVHYLGSTPLQNKVTSLSGLQTPLKDLYFAYRKNFRHKNALTGRLEISKSGLKVGYKGEKGDLEQLNPFPTIAVWSAVKFVVQPSEKNKNQAGYAFLPLITDPDHIDRQALFKTLDPPDRKYILSHNENSHSPLFAVVMRKIGVAKQLECHGFVCQTSEDAIVIAATLYKSLMSHMSRQGHNDKKKFKNQNGVSCMSVASSFTQNDVPVRPPRKKRSTSSLSGESDRADGFSACELFIDKPKLERTKKISSESLPPPPPPPSVPPADLRRITVEEVKAKLDSIKHNDTASSSGTRGSKKKKNKEPLVNKHLLLKAVSNQQNTSSNESSVRSKVSEKIELFRELERRKELQRPPTLPPPIPTKPPEVQQEVLKEPLRRNHSGRKSLNESGDILTKVAIPRSGSFLNAGGLTRYKSIGHRNNGKKGGGSPLGFNELFNEFKVQENLHSMDEILNAIIDAEGMSFNDLKPIYKEFLLKLAVTLTKDEIFQHSKAIMKKQRKKILRRNSSFQNKRRKIFKGANGLRMVFRMPFGKDAQKKEKEVLSSLDFHTLVNTKEPVSESSVSTSSYDIRQFRPKEPMPVSPKRQTMRQRNSKRSDKIVHVSKRNGKVSRPGERTSTSEDSDFLTLSNRLCQNRNSSSGYVSCSECESESCVDRCYCSLKDDCHSKCYCTSEFRKDSKARLSKSKSCKDCSKEYEGDLSYCSCDSESCADSNKCYCAGAAAGAGVGAGGTRRSTHSLEYVRGAQHAYSERMRRAYPHTDTYNTRKSSASSLKRSRRTLGGAASAGGAPGAGGARSAESLALDYELLLQNKPRDRARNMQRLTVRSTGAGSHDALSVKKSAEMAALFADVRLSQRTDVRSLRGRARLPPPPARPPPPLALAFSSLDHRPLTRNASLEHTLGYLP